MYFSNPLNCHFWRIPYMLSIYHMYCNFPRYTRAGQRYVFIQLYLKGQSPSNMDNYSISAADYHKQYCTITFLIRFANMHVRAYKKRSYFWEVLILNSIYCLYTCLYIMQSSRACLYCVQCPVYTCLCTEYTCMCTMYSTVYFVHAFLRFTVHACVLCT